MVKIAQCWSAEMLKVLKMAANEYHFITEWHIPGEIQEVFEVIADDSSLRCWWPSVYLDVQQLKPGNERGIGKEIRLYTKGWLPYTLRWDFTVTESNPPTCFGLEARGDFEGRGFWNLEQHDDHVHVVYDWKILAEKPVLKYLSFVMRPIFAANHRWAMAKGEESLLLELRRRRAKTDQERAAIPAPPPPTFR